MTHRKRALYQALEAAETKLLKYYSQTSQFYGDIYAITAILDPCCKLSTFTTASWDEEGQNWAKYYKQ
ncbi:hypothetical protein BJX76DRAFT_363264 [Aspergillus varians]